MGKTTTPKYRIEMSCVHFINKRREIHSYGFSGHATEKNARLFRDGMNASMQAGGTNAHLSGIHSPYGTARIIEQKTGMCVAEYKPPMFEMIN